MHVRLDRQQLASLLEGEAGVLVQLPGEGRDLLGRHLRGPARVGFRA